MATAAESKEAIVLLRMGRIAIALAKYRGKHHNLRQKYRDIARC